MTTVNLMVNNVYLYFADNYGGWLILEVGGTIEFPRSGGLSQQSCASFHPLGDEHWMLLSNFGICSVCNEELTATTEQ
jgi:hypothetical protein